MSVKPHQTSQYQSTREGQSTQQGERRACERSYVNAAAQSKLHVQKEHGSGEGSEDSKHAALQRDACKTPLSCSGG